MSSPRQVLPYPGSKTRLSAWMADRLPPHTVYLEPFCGSCAVFLAKAPARIEVLNDLDARVATLFRVLRDRPDALARAVALTPYSRGEYAASAAPTDDELEAARRFLVHVWMAPAGKLATARSWRQFTTSGSNPLPTSAAKLWRGIPDRIAAVADRFRDAIIDSRPALEVIAAWRQSEVAIYADPPYPQSALPMNAGATHGGERPRYYRHHLTDAEHLALIAALEAHPGPVLLSGYRCPLYDQALTDWDRQDTPALSYRQGQRTESLWHKPRTG